MPRRPKRKGGPSGLHVQPRRLLGQPPEDWEKQDAAARAEGVTWAEWIRDAARRKLRDGAPKESEG